MEIKSAPNIKGTKRECNKEFFNPKCNNLGINCLCQGFAKKKERKKINGCHGNWT